MSELIARPLGTAYWIKLSEVPEKSSGGILLPESMREQWFEGVVVARGPGLTLYGAIRYHSSDCIVCDHLTCSVMWADVGDRVLFKRAALTMIDNRERLAVVHDEHLLGLVDGDGELTPLNDWLLVEFFERRKETTGGLALIERKQRRPDCGTILRYGPGRLRLSGPLAGTRVPIPVILCLEELALVGLRVYWHPRAEVLDIAREKVLRWLVPAGDLVACEENDSAAC